MHIRILLSKYKKSSVCIKCNGSRFNNSSLLWRIANTENNLNEHYDCSRPIPYKNKDALNIADILKMSVNAVL
ncbi:hypothetical protein [Candidatus Kinetoplastidibacterium blastocrithidiae]|uniref:hypothetical protein n=1 Tax=Candidatus Kinetoplastidibacterium blastocrithidiae TaxID=233181 RepID=UPI0002A672E6|nr:hypothetical protein [Candidatus Kinetoplastibacterium blastocrithidii]AFZ83851.1 hypothetical protein CKBE_00661 [Candidatus Kinetoplastibacterium blastocrithidii (ex Strigomonas culicis)]